MVARPAPTTYHGLVGAGVAVAIALTTVIGVLVWRADPGRTQESAAAPTIESVPSGSSGAHRGPPAP